MLQFYPTRRMHFEIHPHFLHSEGSLWPVFSSWQATAGVWATPLGWADRRMAKSGECAGEVAGHGGVGGRFRVPVRAAPIRVGPWVDRS